VRRFTRQRLSTAHRLSQRLSVMVRALPGVAALILILMLALVEALVLEWPALIPWSAFVPVIILSGLFLPPRWLGVVLLVTTILLAYDGWSLRGKHGDYVAAVIILALMAAMMTWLAVSRAPLGVQGTLAESMLVDLRDRIRAQSELPKLPEPWHAEVEVKSAYFEPFSGDFAVGNLSDSGDWFEVALVDVSGKGMDAGTRALLLSGAIGSLLGAMQPEDLLGATNSYLLRQDWTDGFATAVHVALELDTGRFTVGGAGHPPAVKFWAGSGKWQVLDAANGPLLGVLPEADFPRSHGQLLSGDALLLYTDGVIESRFRDLTVGIDRMLGEAERLVAQGFAGGASRICGAALAGRSDDRAVVLIWRS
jgi:hypothetical protein